MSTDEIPFSIPAVWSVFYSMLKGTLWEGEDIEHAVYRRNHDAMGAALALRAVHQMEWKGVDAEDGILATLKAARQFHRGAFLTPSQVKEMGGRFTAYYRDLEEPMDDYLEEHCGEVRWSWLNDHGRSEIMKAVVRDSEIWVDDDDDDETGVWVFTKPGQT